MILKDRVAVVTGAGRGIGRAIALEMAKQGAGVVVNDVDTEPAEKVAEEIKKTGGKASSDNNTVSTMEGAEAIIRTATENFGQIDILVNNAGVIRDRMFVNMTEEEWDQVISVHLKGHFCCTKAAVGHMKEGSYGRVINVTSKAGLKGNMGQSNYSSAKAGVMGFTKTLSMELKKYNITVNAISPGAKTRMIMSIPEHVIREKAKTDPRARALLNLPGPEYIAPVVAYLASEDAADITGRIIGVKGGRLALWSYPEELKVMEKDDIWTVEEIKSRLRSEFDI